MPAPLLRRFRKQEEQEAAEREQRRADRERTVDVYNDEDAGKYKKGNGASGRLSGHRSHPGCLPVSWTPAAAVSY